jgi:hypothetical protein
MAGVISMQTHTLKVHFVSDGFKSTVPFKYIFPMFDTGHFRRDEVLDNHGNNNVTYITIARLRLDRHIPAKRTRSTEGRPLLGNGPVNTPP